MNPYLPNREWQMGDFVPKNSIFQEKSEDLDDCLERRNIQKIINNKSLFWLAYCKAFHNAKKEETGHSFSISINEKNINYSGSNHTIEKTKKIIEDLRLFFVEGLESKKDFEFLALNRLDAYHYCKPSPSLIDLSEVERGCERCDYNKVIKPALPELFKFCGALYTEGEKTQLFRAVEFETATIKKVEAIKITWLKETLITYPIAPKIISEHPETQKTLYSLYEKQQLCDFTILAKDKAIQVHSCLLYANGGPVMQKLLTAEMEEASKKTISFSEYSATTIEAFLYFVYLGGKEWMDRFTSPKNEIEVNLFELFEFANIYQIDNLIDCCTNLMSLFATSKDLDLLKHLAHLYQNEHLSRLCEHLGEHLESIDLIKSIDIDL